MKDRIQILEACNKKDLETWMALWTEWPEREVFAHPGYVRLFENDENKAMCAFMVSPEGNVLYPFLLRKIDGKLYGDAAGGSYCDISTPYGYGGPAAWGFRDRNRLADIFWKQFDDWVRTNRVISEFIRFSLRDSCLLTYPGHVEMKFNNIIRNVDMSPDMLLADFEHAVRNNIKKAQKKGVSVIVDTDGNLLDEFLRIYYGIMDRCQAAEAYYFPRSFFEAIHRDLAGMFCYFHAVIGGQVVCSVLNLYSQRSAYSFLGGANSEFLKYQVNTILHYEEFLRAHDLGKKDVVLGGGHGSDDGVYRFKRSLAPKGVVPFYCGSRIFLPDVYREMVEGRKKILRQQQVLWEPKLGFFPAYRA